MPDTIKPTTYGHGSHASDALITLRTPPGDVTSAPWPRGKAATVKRYILAWYGATDGSEGRPGPETAGAIGPFDLQVSSCLDEGGSLVESVTWDIQSDSKQASASAENALLGIASKIGPAIYFVRDRSCAAFVDDDGGVELVIHSRWSKRQLSFETDRLGKTVAVLIDEHMRQSEREVSSREPEPLLELVAWLRSKS